MVWSSQSIVQEWVSVNSPHGNVGVDAAREEKAAGVLDSITVCGDEHDEADHATRARELDSVSSTEKIV